MGGGGPLGSAEWQQCNVNDLTDLGRFDPISGFPVYKTLLCRVRKLGDNTGATIRCEGMAPVAEVQDDELLSSQEIKTPTVTPRAVYLDHNATTPVDPQVREAMLPFLSDQCGNPSSIHSFGNIARTALEAARRTVAQGLNCTARRVIFTGGGSEADNLAIRGIAAASDGSRRHLITSSIEHPAVLGPCRALAAQGYQLTILPVNNDGVVEPATLAAAVRPDTLLVSVMLANNETGAILPIKELAQIAHGCGALFHTDAVQAFGKIPIDVDELGVDLLAVSAHKLHGPKGVGALYLRKDVAYGSVVKGGGQERGCGPGPRMSRE